MLLLVDGHTSNVNLLFLELCISHGVDLFCGFPQTTTVTAPLDALAQSQAEAAAWKAKFEASRVETVLLRVSGAMHVSAPSFLLPLAAP